MPSKNRRPKARRRPAARKTALIKLDPRLAGRLPGAIGATLPGAVTLMMPKGPLFVGSYHRIPVRVSAASGLSFDALEFRVSHPEGGLVSASRDDSASAKRPQIVLLAGSVSGAYKVLIFKAGSTSPIGSETFRVTSVWTDRVAGPSLWFESASRTYAAGATWGGGGSGPQNESVHAQSGVRRIAIVLVDTKTQRYTSDATTLQGFRDRWMDQVINGVTFNGMTRSTREYYREASFNAFDLSADVYGPFNLTDEFD